MKKNNFFTSLPFKLLMGVFLGICIGLVLNYADGNAATKAILNVVVTAKYILGQLINFCVPSSDLSHLLSQSLAAMLHVCLGLLLLLLMFPH